MAMNNQLLAVVQHIENERGVSREIVLTAIEAAIQQAAKKNANVTNDVKVVIDRKDLSLHVYDKLVCSDEDTGPGFAPTDDDEPNYALKNIRERLKTMCGGTLEIEEREAGGTRVTIFIPQDEGK